MLFCFCLLNLAKTGHVALCIRTRQNVPEVPTSSVRNGSVISGREATSSVSPNPLRPIVYYEFLQGHAARTSAANISVAFEKDIIHHAAVSQRSRRRFAQRPESEANTREFATTLGRNPTTTIYHCHDLGCRKVVSTWRPHELRDAHQAYQINIA